MSTTEIQVTIAELVYNHILNLCPITVKSVPTIGEVLRNILEIINDKEFKIDVQFVKNVMKNYFDLSAYKSKEDKILLFTIESCIKSAIVYNLSILPEYMIDMLTTEVELLEEYPSFTDPEIDSTELTYLLAYRNMMRISLDVIPSKGNKALLMRICSILEGSGRTYSTGGTQSNATTRRVFIYELESGKQLRSSLITRDIDCKNVKANKQKVTCAVCRAEILVRTMWKHRKSRKHRLNTSFQASLSRGSNSNQKK